MAEPRSTNNPLTWLLVGAIFAGISADAIASRHHHKHVAAHRIKKEAASHHKDRSAKTKSNHTAQSVSAETLAALPPDFRAVKQALDLVRQRKWAEATAVEKSIEDPAARKLAEWLLLRHAESEAGFERFAAFIDANPDWPGIPRLRRRAEARLWQERRDAATVRRFVGDEPVGAVGRLALARALLDSGDREGAERQVRTAWHSPELSAEAEIAALGEFHDILTRDDERARMDRLIGAKDFGAATRAAKRLGGSGVAIVKACIAAEANAAKAGAQLDAIPADARRDLGYALCRLHTLMHHEETAAAVKLVLASAGDDRKLQDTDEWWRELRLLARRLLDAGDAKTAYRVVVEAAPPINPYYRADAQFMPGWIALRFLNDPTTALEHFAHVDDGQSDPLVKSRAAYWRGRANEEAGRAEDARTEYEAAAAYPTAYYGQLARAKIDPSGITLSAPPAEPDSAAAPELLHAADILYAIGEHDFVMGFVGDLADESSDAGSLAAIGELAERHRDPQAVLSLGKRGLARGLALDLYAFPDIGVPAFSPIGPELDRSVVYSIVRTESAFDQRDRSAAKAVGLMQITPEAGRDTAKRFGVAYDWDRLVSDPVYNTQMGAAELAALFKDYRGSLIMTFAGYNAGRGRVQEWVAQHGDPRDPKVDPVDWVERIPFSETRNYVQRVMENVQVYRVRLGSGITVAEANLPQTTASAAAQPSAEPLSYAEPASTDEPERY
jgi:soluble lytic murein transglycosylase